MRLDPILVHNRAPVPLTATKGGRAYTIPPGRSWLFQDVVPFARQQNIIPGTEDVRTHRYESYIAVVVDTAKNPKAKQIHPIDDIPMDVYNEIVMGNGERIDRDTLPPDRQRTKALPMRTRQGARMPFENAPGGDTGIGVMMNPTSKE